MIDGAGAFLSYIPYCDITKAEKSKCLFFPDIKIFVLINRSGWMLFIHVSHSKSEFCTTSLLTFESHLINYITQINAYLMDCDLGFYSL